MTITREYLDQNNRKLLMDRSVPGRMGTTLPKLDVPAAPLPDKSMLRDSLEFPEVTENEIVRYFTQLSQLNFSIDTQFYPLGSCTMKYNPKLHEEMSFQPGFANIHPNQSAESVQGALKLMYDLQGLLCEITGMKGASLTPMAGADGELAGMLMTRAYHQSRGDLKRTKVLIPDSAHGTNPASAAMAGFEVVTLKSDANGNTDLEALKSLVGPDLAGLMITLPSTLGLFDTNILEVVRIVKENGGVIYGDGANLNALLGRVKLGELGFDVIHSNLHKTFSTPHGGGGPGAGPVMVGERLAPFLPAPIVAKKKGDDGKDAYDYFYPPQTIGKMGAFQGNFGMFIRAYTFIRLLGNTGIDKIGKDAVINANYVQSQLKGYYHLPYDRTCMHEVVFSAKNLKKAHDVDALDVAKRLIDYNIHPPTMYFPLIVEQALMIEPTESESVETLDTFIEVMKTIAQEAKDNPELLHDAPHNTPNTRLDEARAARKPDLRWKKA
ncbi:MAG: glycine dehydrogenase subunit 2 [SAR202 cluster bacterium]|nr:glycine dehydrogenase subunit 2 [SAR202 cluster bacterium]